VRGKFVKGKEIISFVDIFLNFLLILRIKGMLGPEGLCRGSNVP